MTSFVWQDGPHVVYLDLSNQVHQAWYNSSSNSWADQNITATVSALPALAGSPLTAFVISDGTHIVYVANNQHLQQAWYNAANKNWYVMDITANVNGPLVSATTGMTSFQMSSDGPHIAYTSSSQHLQQVWYTVASGQWASMDITANVNGPLLSLTAGLTSFQLSGEGPHVIYTDISQHLQQAWYNITYGHWYTMDITANINGPLVSSSSGVSTVLASDGPHVMYVASNQHLQQAWYNTSIGNWYNQDLNPNSSTPLASASSGITTFLLADGLHIDFTDVDGHVYQLWYNTAGNWITTDITLAAKASGGAYALSATEYVYLGSRLVAVEHW